MWTDLVAWFQSPAGARVLQSAVIPALAILVAGVIAALIGRAAIRAALARADREQAAAVVSGLVEAARASADPDPTDKDRRRAGRLRSELDVRTRLLPLKGADLAADWAAGRIEALQGAAGEGDLAAFRDRLIAWTRRPRRARSLFAEPKPRAASAPKRRGGAPAKTPATDLRQQTTSAAEQPDRSPATPATADAAPAQQTSAVAAPATPAAPAAGIVAEPSTASVAVAATPAWRRARAAADARSGQEQAEEARDEPETQVSTAPVVVQHQHRAAGAPATDADEAVRLEAQQLARRSRTAEEQAAAAAATSTAATAKAAPAKPAEPERAPDKGAAASAPVGRVTPAWLDTYDDEADVTANLNLKTPPPVAAAAVRDRTRSGEDIVPRE